MVVVVEGRGERLAQSGGGRYLGCERKYMWEAQLDSDYLRGTRWDSCRLAIALSFSFSLGNGVLLRVISRCARCGNVGHVVRVEGRFVCVDPVSLLINCRKGLAMTETYMWK